MSATAAPTVAVPVLARFGCASGMAIGWNRLVPALPSRSTPSFCCAFISVLSVSAIRPNPSRASARSLFWKRSSPATAPPPSVDSSIVVVSVPRESVSLLVLPSPFPSASWADEAPSTSAWLPTNTLSVPSSAATVEVCTCWLSSRSTWSRWSSRSFGVWPPLLAPAICWFSEASVEAMLLMLLTASPSCEFTPCCRSSIWDCALRNRAAVSSMRAMTALRAVTSVGVLATSENALSMSLTEAPRPLVPPWKISSSEDSRLARVESIACTDCACAA